MLAEEHLRDGKLDEALAELKKAIQQDPSNSDYRVFLFQMFTVIGKWDSALTQLELSGDLEPGTLAMVQAYREAIRCEKTRQRVFAGETSPLIFGEPEHWLALLVESLKMSASGQHAEATKLRDQAFDAAPATGGQIELHGDQQAEFEWIADADPRLGPVLEVLVNGQYYWVPFHRIAQIDFEAPADLRDFVWTPAHFVWSNGGDAVGLIPTRYPGSENIDDPAIRLSRKTDWQTLGGGTDDELSIGIGQRMLASESAEYALLDIRKLKLNVQMEVPAEESPEQGAEENGDG